MLTVCTFLFDDPSNKRAHLYTKGEQHVASLVRQVKEHLALRHRFVLITDRPRDVPCEQVPWDRSVHVAGRNYVKLMLFSPDIGKLLDGDRILYMDLDSVLIDSIDALAARPEPLVLWRHPRYNISKTAASYNTSLILLTAGCRPQVYKDFSPNLAKRGTIRGSDQAWVHHKLGPNESIWESERDGIYSINMIESLPKNARIVTFPGKNAPWSPNMLETHEWIRPNLL